MKDLDFDELDRAVNSLMSNVPKTTPQTTDANEKMLDLTSSFGNDNAQATPEKVEDMAKKVIADTPSIVEPPVDTPSSTATPRPAALAIKPPVRSVSTPAARRAGRFMDVVHPSSDMKKPETPHPVSRQGVTIEPAGKAAPGEPVIQAPSFTSAPVMPEIEKESKEEEIVAPTVDTMPIKSELSKPEEPKESSDDQSNSSDWPDPLDMAAKNDSSVPLTSPFLADAKVEKRPLGGLGPADIVAKESETPEPIEPETKPVDLGATSETSKEELVASDEAEKSAPSVPLVKPVSMPSDQNAAVLLPEELQGDLMAVEADTTHDEIKQKHDSVEKEQQAEGDQKPSVSEAPKVIESKDEPSVPAGPTSIPQQYREEPSTGDQDNGAIYDTSTYHQPLAHPAKKKPSWLWIVWIVAILLLGAAGGAIVYFMKLV